MCARRSAWLRVHFILGSGMHGFGGRSRRLRQKFVAVVKSRKGECGHCGIGRLRWLSSYGKAAHATEFVALAVVMSADAACVVRDGRGSGGGVLGGGFRIGFHGEALHGLQSGGNGFLIGLGASHLRIEALINLAESGIVRADGRHRVIGILRCGAGWASEFFISISISVHDSDRLTWGYFSSSESAQAGGFSTTGKLDLPFRFGGHSVAGGGTIAPRADGSQHVAVTRGTPAPQNQRTMHAAVGTDDEAYFDFQSRFDRDQQRVGRGEGLRRPGVFAARARAHMRDVAELGGARGRLEGLVFALGYECLTQTRTWNLHGSGAGSGNREDKEPRPDAKHI